MSVAINAIWDMPSSIEIARHDADDIAKANATSSVVTKLFGPSNFNSDIASFDRIGQRVVYTLIEDSDVLARKAHWQKFVSDPLSSTDIDALTETAKLVLEEIGRFGPTRISLERLDPARVSGEHLATVLRATFNFRSQVPGWRDSVSVAETALSRVGIDSSEALFGLV